MYLFPGAEIFKIAMTIEENGERFYQQALPLARDEETRQIFQRLIEDEGKHHRYFEALLSKVKDAPATNSITEEYQKYLNAFIEKILFPKELPEDEQSRLKDVFSAIRFAIQKELDSIYYYKEIKNFIPENHHQDVDAIIEEERRHFMELIQLEKKLR